MLKRLVGSTSQVLTTGGWPLARRNVARTVASDVDGFAIRTKVSNSWSLADASLRQRPLRRRGRDAEAVVRLEPGARISRPVHGALRHHRDVGHHRRRHRGIGERRILAVHVHREAAVGRHLLAAHQRRAVVLEERHGQVRHRGIGIADEDVRVEVRARRALGVEPPGRGLPARRPIRGRPRRAGVPKYIARSAMIGSVDVTTIEKDLPISCGMVPA